MVVIRFSPIQPYMNLTYQISIVGSMINEYMYQVPTLLTNEWTE